jgi:hypothetical protein
MLNVFLIKVTVFAEQVPGNVYTSSANIRALLIPLKLFSYIRWVNKSHL